jgi:hypothetical protein
MPNPLYLQRHHQYFLGILRELEVECQKRPAWVFLCCSAMIEYLAKMSVDPAILPLPSDAQAYMTFIETRMPSTYRDFEYLVTHPTPPFGSPAGTTATSRRDLPLQMYCILRCGLVHSFSMYPNPRYTTHGPGRFARPRSIVLTHRRRRNQIGVVHLENYAGLNGNLDSAQFVLQDFISDIRTAINALFLAARNDTHLRQVIRSNLSTQPPLNIV